MPLRLSQMDDEGVEAIASRISTLAARPAESGRALSAARTDPLTLGVAHQTFTLGLDQLEGPGVVDSVAATGRRYLVFEGDRSIAAAESAEVDGRPVFASVNEGPFVQATQTAIEASERIPAVESGSYEVSLVRIPAIYVMALWLRDEEGSNDLYVPLDPAPPELEPERPYPGPEFFATLRSIAAARGEGGDLA